MSDPNAPLDDALDASSQLLLQPQAPTRNESSRYSADDDTRETVSDHQSLNKDQKPDYDQNNSRQGFGLEIQEIPGHIWNKVDGKQPRKTKALAVWSLEISLLLIASGLLVSIFLILKKYDKQELPDWDIVGITLNALVATLATVIRAIIALVAFEALSQIKWDWIFGRFRPLNHLQLFDDASRGIYGSLRLLPVIALHQPLAIGAIAIAVLSLGIGPITQQAIQTYACRRAGQSSSTILIANRVDTQNLITYEAGNMYKLKVGIKSAMEDSIINPSTDSNIGSIFSCPSGNCTFTKYADSPGEPGDKRISHASVGMCSRCESVYSLVEGPFVASSSDLSRSYRLPTSNPTPLTILLGGGPDPKTRVYLAVNATGNLTWARETVPLDLINEARWSLANFSILAVSQASCDHLPDGNISCPHFNDQPIDLPEGANRSKVRDALAWNQPVDYTAATCILYPCIKYYNASIENGVLLEKVVRSTPLRQQIYFDGMMAATLMTSALVSDWEGIQLPCLVNGTFYTSSNMSSSAKLGPNVTVTTLTHSKDWDKEDADAPAQYVNTTTLPECVFKLPGTIIQAVMHEMDRTFTANCSLSRYGDNVLCDSTNESPTAHMAAFLHNCTTTIDTIRENTDSMAMRITTELRKAGWGPFQDERAEVKGQTWENRVCIRVAWWWLALPTTLLALSILLLSGIILKDSISNDSILWKSSILPFLLMNCVDAGHYGLEDLCERARGFQVKFQRDGK